MHDPTPPLTTDGTRNFDQPMEDEAAFLGGALLIPRSRAIEVVKQNASLETVASTFKVSVQLARWRLGGSGAKNIVARSRKKWGR